MAETNQRPDNWERLLRPDLIAGIRGLGTEAVEQFLDGLSPLVQPIIDGTQGDSFNQFLYEWSLTLSVIESAGGLAGWKELEERASVSTDVCTPDELIARLGAIITDSVPNEDQSFQ